MACDLVYYVMTSKECYMFYLSGTQGCLATISLL